MNPYQSSLRPNWICRIAETVLVIAAGPWTMLAYDGYTRFPSAPTVGRYAGLVNSVPPGT